MKRAQLSKGNPRRRRRPRYLCPFCIRLQLLRNGAYQKCQRSSPKLIARRNADQARALRRRIDRLRQSARWLEILAEALHRRAQELRQIEPQLWKRGQFHSLAQFVAADLPPPEGLQ